jgi:hypothetical protein
MVAGRVVALPGWLVVLPEGLDVFSLRAGVTGERGLPSGSLCFAKSNFGSVDVWELNPEGLGPLWLRACMVECGFLNFTLEFAVQLRKTRDRYAFK